MCFIDINGGNISVLIEVGKFRDCLLNIFFSK